MNTSPNKQLRNDKTAYVNKINSKTSEIFNHYNELQLLQKNEYSKKDVELKQGDFGLANIASTLADLLEIEKDPHWLESLIIK